MDLGLAAIKGQYVTVQYTQSVTQASQHLADQGGTKVASMAAPLVVMNGVGVAPVLTSVVVKASAPSVVVLGFNESIVSGAGFLSDFAVKLGAVSSVAKVPVLGALLVNGFVHLTLAAPVAAGKDISVSYAKSAVSAQKLAALNSSYPVDSFESDLTDDNDAFPLDPSKSADADGDGVDDTTDTNTDTDGDGIDDGVDAFPLDKAEWTDTDKDGVGDNVETDDDGDGVTDGLDAFPADPAETKDLDGDGVGDNADGDDDGDGLCPGCFSEL